MSKIIAVTTTGGSMRPLLHSGDCCLVQCKTDITFHIGDPVCYIEGDKTYIHRIWWIKKNSFLIGDDAAICSPHFINTSSIIGRPVLFLKGPIGLFFGILSHLFFFSARRLKSLTAALLLIVSFVQQRYWD